MEKLFSCIILMVAVLLLIPGCFAEEKTATKEKISEPTVQVTMKEPVLLKNATITANETVSNLSAPIGETILISLKENPTTGYTWNVTNSSGLELIADTYEMEKVKEGIVGAGGVHSWILKTTEIGNQTFSGIYKHSWEADSKEDQTYKLDVTVR